MVSLWSVYGQGVRARAMAFHASMVQSWGSRYGAPRDAQRITRPGAGARHPAWSEEPHPGGERMPGPPQWCFGPFRLDPSAEVLWRDECVLPLPPKPFAVLAYLV